MLPATPTHRWGGLTFLGVILLVIAVLVNLLFRPAAVVADSPEFKRALNAWAPLLGGVLTTPRDAKRFLNRLRYYAMMIGDTPVSRWRQRFDWIRQTRLVTWLFRKMRISPPPIDKPKDKIPDHVLVAFSAITAFKPEWLEPDQLICLLDDFKAFILKNVSAEHASAIFVDEYPAALHAHWARFLDISRTISSK